MANYSIRLFILVTLIAPAHAIDVADLWQPGEPVASEVRMLEALEDAHGDEAYAANAQRYYIHDELSLLYTAVGDNDRARHFSEHSAALKHRSGH